MVAIRASLRTHNTLIITRLQARSHYVLTLLLVLSLAQDRFLSWHGFEGRKRVCRCRRLSSSSSWQRC